MKSSEEQKQQEEAQKEFDQFINAAKKQLKQMSKNDLVREMLGLMLGYQALKHAYDELSKSKEGSSEGASSGG